MALTLLGFLVVFMAQNMQPLMQVSPRSMMIEVSVQSPPHSKTTTNIKTHSPWLFKPKFTHSILSTRWGYKVRIRMHIAADRNCIMHLNKLDHRFLKIDSQLNKCAGFEYLNKLGHPRWEYLILNNLKYYI